MLIICSFSTPLLDAIVWPFPSNWKCKWKKQRFKVRSYLAAIVATFTIQAMICPPNVFTWIQMNYSQWHLYFHMTNVPWKNATIDHSSLYSWRNKSTWRTWWFACGGRTSSTLSTLVFSAATPLHTAELSAGTERHAQTTLLHFWPDGAVHHTHPAPQSHWTGVLWRCRCAASGPVFAQLPRCIPHAPSASEEQLASASPVKKHILDF